MLEQIHAEYGGRLAHVVGNATDDHSLIAAGIERAAGLITALSSDPGRGERAGRRLRGPSGHFVYNPPAEHRIESGSFIVVLGTREGVRKLRPMLGN